MEHELNRRFFETLYQSNDVEEGVQKVLAMIGERFSVSRVYVFENTKDDLYADNTFEWCAKGIEPQIENLQHMSYEKYGYKEMFGENGLLFVADVNALEATQRELFEMQGIKATMQYAMYEKGRLRGFIGVDDCLSARPDWDKDKDILDTLVLLSKILTMYLLKERNLQSSWAYHEQLTQALERTREALDKAKKADQTKTDFLARMSHDMRTPLNAILGMVHLAKEDDKKGLSITGYIRQIEESSQYLLGVINDLLEMSRIENGSITITPGWYSLSDLVMPVIRMIEPMIEKKMLHFECDITRLQALNIAYYVDSQKFQQILINILNNACKFTPEGGTVSFRFVNVLQDVESGVSTDQLIIQDTGCGMSETFMTRIFQPFEQERLPGTENIPGTGLGLAIAHNNARKMGGDITVTSKLGKGSTFTITHTHPYRILTEDAPQEREEASLEPYRDLYGKCILLAEDNEINAMIATKLLENKGMHVKLVRNGQEAVDAFTEVPEGTYDLILMDIRMPILDGLEATEKIRSTSRMDAKMLPIVAMSANAFEEDRQLSLASGMTDHLSKPVEPELLYQTILKYI